jgi:hypothetical protein
MCQNIFLDAQLNIKHATRLHREAIRNTSVIWEANTTVGIVTRLRSGQKKNRGSDSRQEQEILPPIQDSYI